MIFHTETGSAYEVDFEKSQIRRLGGEKLPTPRMGKEGEWRQFVKLSPATPVVGQSVIIVWDPANVSPIDPDCNVYLPMTTTSRVLYLTYGLDHN